MSAEHAETLARYAESGNPGEALVQATLAQTHATLALVEEQRTANLIAYATASGAGGTQTPMKLKAWQIAADRLGLTEQEQH